MLVEKIRSWLKKTRFLFTTKVKNDELKILMMGFLPIILSNIYVPLFKPQNFSPEIRETILYHTEVYVWSLPWILAFVLLIIFIKTKDYIWFILTNLSIIFASLIWTLASLHAKYILGAEFSLVYVALWFSIFLLSLITVTRDWKIIPKGIK